MDNKPNHNERHVFREQSSVCGRWYNQDSGSSSRKGKSHALSSPVTDVSCDVRPASTYARNLTYAIDPSSADVGSYVGGDDPSFLSNNLDLRDIWSEATLKKPPHTMVRWEEFEDTKGVMRLKAFILTPEDSYGPAKVSICNVAATWVPTTYSRIQSQGEGVVTNFTFIRNQGRSPLCRE